MKDLIINQKPLFAVAFDLIFFEGLQQIFFKESDQPVYIFQRME